MKYKITLEWFDYRCTLIMMVKYKKVCNMLFNEFFCRLEFWNLKKQDSSNALNRDEIDKIWMPNLVFSNTDNNEIIESDHKTEIVASRKSSPK